MILCGLTGFAVFVPEVYHKVRLAMQIANAALLMVLGGVGLYLGRFDNEKLAHHLCELPDTELMIVRVQPMVSQTLHFLDGRWASRGILYQPLFWPAW